MSSSKEKACSSSSFVMTSCVPPCFTSASASSSLRSSPFDDDDNIVTTLFPQTDVLISCVSLLPLALTSLLLRPKSIPSARALFVPGPASCESYITLFGQYWLWTKFGATAGILSLSRYAAICCTSPLILSIGLGLKSLTINPQALARTSK